MTCSSSGSLLLIASPEIRCARLRDRIVAGLSESVCCATDIAGAMSMLTECNSDVIALVLDPENARENTEHISILSEFVPEIPLVVFAEFGPTTELRATLREASCDFVQVGVEHSNPATLARRCEQAIETARVRGRALEADARFRRLYETSIAGIFAMNGHGDFISANPAALSMLGYTGEQDLLQVNFVDDVCLPKEIAREFMRCLENTGSLRNAELVLSTADNRSVTVLVCATSVLDSQGDIDYIEATMIDISERKKAQDELTYLAKFDRLTGLANRYLFKEALSKALARSQRQSYSVALLMIDMDRFKEVNDTMGHDAGDALLRAVGSRLKSCTRQGDTVARLGGDEFAVLLEARTDAIDEATAVARKICETLAKPYKINGHELVSTPSIGIATSPSAGTHGEQLLKAGDIAMYRAKAEGRNRYVFYSQVLHREVMERVQLEHNLRLAAEKPEFFLAYQPKVSLATGQIVELEVLLRWTCSERGPVGPAEFVPVLERTGLINPVGQWVIRTAVGQLAAWQETYDRPDLRLAINLSVRQLSQRQLLVDDIASVISETGVRPHTLEFEITESMLMHDPESCITTLTSLRDLGVRVCIDDFGTGFSSLQYLKNLPIHGLKIDRTFVRETPGNSDDVAIVRATLALAHSLGLTVTAEGVENAAQADFLRESGCELAQGYYFARPTEAERLPDLLLANPAELPGIASIAETKEERREAGYSQPPYQVDTSSTAQLPFFDLSRVRH